MDSQLPFEVSRTPLSGSSWSFRSAVLKFPRSGTVKARPTIRVRIFCAVFIVLGVGLLALAVLPASAFAALGFPWIAELELMRSLGLGWIIRGFRLVLPLVAGLLFLGVGVGCAVSAARAALTFDLRGGVLRTKRRVSGLGSEIPLHDVAAVQILFSKRFGACEMNLVLFRPAGERLSVMCHAHGRALRHDAGRLAECLRVPLLDHTAAAEKAGGREEEIEKVLLKGVRASDYRSKALRVAGPGRMVLKPTFGSKAGRWTLFGCGGFAVLLSVATAVFGLISAEWGLLLGGALSAALGLPFILLGRWVGREHPIVFDRARGVVRGPELRLGEEIRDEIPLRNVQALQICSEFADVSSYFQLNLVLADPPGARIALVTQGNRPALRRDAKRLAEFLRVPLIDHTESD